MQTKHRKARITLKTTHDWRVHEIKKSFAVRLDLVWPANEQHRVSNAATSFTVLNLTTINHSYCCHIRIILHSVK